MPIQNDRKQFPFLTSNKIRMYKIKAVTQAEQTKTPYPQKPLRETWKVVYTCI